jgi:hypothetical protein
MKNGRSIEELAKELQTIKDGSHDYLAPAPQLQMQADRSLHVGTRSFSVRPYAHGQIAALAGIPKPYYDRMLADAPDLLARNVNRWFTQDRVKDRQMVRTVGTDVRAVVSDTFRCLDNYDLAEVALPEFTDKGAIIQSCEVTERRFYLKATMPSLRAVLGGDSKLPVGAQLATYDEIPNYEARKAENARRGFKVGDVVEAMLCLSNSEVGSGSISIEWGTMTLACLNALIIPGDGFKRRHVGRRYESIEDENVRAIISDQARAADDKAFWLKIRDLIRYAFDEKRFSQHVNKLVGAQSDTIAGDLAAVVERVTEKFSFSDSMGSSVLKHLINGGQLNRYGLVQAVTRASADIQDYDVATETERVGGEILELPKQEWAQLAA